MEDVNLREQNREIICKNGEHIRNYGSVLLYLVLCNYIPGWFGGVRDDTCQALAKNNQFAILTAVVVAFPLLIWVGYNLQRCFGRSPSLIREWLTSAHLVASLIISLVVLIGYTTFFYSSFNELSSANSTACSSGWN